MKAVLTFVFFMMMLHSYGQYYFNDIVSSRMSNEQYRLLRAGKIKKVAATSYDADNSVTEGFLLEQDISADGKKIVTVTQALSKQKNTETNTYELGKLKRNISDDNSITTKTDYTYDDRNRLSRILFTSVDTANKVTITEAHEWIYDNESNPVTMLKIKNRTDTTFIDFTKDEQGNTAEEHWRKNGRTIETYYYYYNDKKELTDIVRYNSKLKRLLPDYLYEYDTNGRISKMTQVSMANNSSYFTWTYTYNEKGLKEKEVCFNKAKQLVGSLVYTYEINN